MEAMESSLTLPASMMSTETVSMWSGLLATLGTVLVSSVFTMLQLAATYLSEIRERPRISSLMFSNVVFISVKIAPCPEETQLAGSGVRCCLGGD